MSPNNKNSSSSRRHELEAMRVQWKWFLALAKA